MLGEYLRDFFYKRKMVLRMYRSMPGFTRYMYIVEWFRLKGPRLEDDYNAINFKRRA